MFSAMARVFAIVIKISPPSSSRELNCKSHETFHGLWLAETGSSLSVTADHSQLHGSCPNPTFQQQFLFQNANSHFLHHRHAFLKLLAPFIEGSFLFLWSVFHPASSANRPFHLEQAIKAPQDGLIWPTFHWKLFLLARLPFLAHFLRWQLAAPSFAFIRRGSLFSSFWSLFTVSNKSQGLVLQLVSPPAQSYAWLPC